MVVGDGKGIPLGGPLSPCIPGGSSTRGADVRFDPRRSAASSVTSATEAGARDHRQSLRRDPLRFRLRRRGIELICPHKNNRARPATQDKRARRRYR